MEFLDIYSWVAGWYEGVQGSAADTGGQMQVRPVIKYKVVTRMPRSKRLFSCVAPPCVRVEYHKGRWKTAKVGGLLVFRTLAAARRYGNCTGDIIYRCECKDQMLLPRDSLLLNRITVKRARALWQGMAVDRYLFDSHWPPGTQAFRKVKLVEEVEA